MAAAWTETSGTLTNTIATLAANANRREVIFSNNSDTVMTFLTRRISRGSIMRYH